MSRVASSVALRTPSLPPVRSTSRWRERGCLSGEAAMSTGAPETGNRSSRSRQLRGRSEQNTPLSFLIRMHTVLTYSLPPLSSPYFLTSFPPFLSPSLSPRALEQKKQAMARAEEERRKKALEERRQSQREATERCKLGMSRLKGSSRLGSTTHPRDIPVEGMLDHELWFSFTL